MQITVQNGSSTITLDVESSDTVIGVKAKIKDQIGMALIKQQLTFNGTVLDNDQVLSYYNIQKNAELILTLILVSKQARQIAKLELAQTKRRAGGDTTKPYYRARNTYNLTLLPDTYNVNVPGADDNPNTGGLVEGRPWVSVVNPAPVTQDLILFFDSERTDCYPGTGTTIYNLVDNTPSTLFGDVTFSDGVLRISNTDTPIAGNRISGIQCQTVTGFKTISLWYKQITDSAGYYSYIVDARTGMPGGWIYDTPSNDYFGESWASGTMFIDGGPSQQPNYTQQLNVWRNVTFVTDGTAFTDDITLFSRYTQTEGLDVEFGACMIYSRAITQAENKQNYDQFKTRYLFSTYESVNSTGQTITTTQTGPFKLTVRSTSYEVTPFVNAQISIDDVLVVNTSGRGHTVLAMTSGGTVISQTRYDTWDTFSPGLTNMNTALLGYPLGTVIAICSYDATSFNATLRDTLNTYYGGTITDTWAPVIPRYSHIFIGTKIEPVSTTVTSGLRLYLDAGKASSYSGSGTTWTDLSANTNNATLVGSPAFTNAGTSSYFTFPNDGAKYATTPHTKYSGTYTGKSTFFVARMDANIADGYHGIFGFNPGRTFNTYIYKLPGPIYQIHASFGTGYGWSDNLNLTTGQWFTFGATQAANGDFTYYFNGNAVGVGTTVQAFANTYSSGTDPQLIGKIDSLWHGDVALVNVYDRTLTGVEMAQNHNAMVGRYGL